MPPARMTYFMVPSICYWSGNQVFQIGRFSLDREVAIGDDESGAAGDELESGQNRASGVMSASPRFSDAEDEMLTRLLRFFVHISPGVPEPLGTGDPGVRCWKRKLEKVRKSEKIYKVRESSRTVRES